jgi:hypothetical protein
MPWTFYNSNGQRLSSAATSIDVLDIDGATDIGAAIVDADLFIIDDGAGGTNRKTAASRIVTYVGANTDTRSGSAKGYCQIAAAGTLVANSYNVASITDSATGDRTIVWDTDFGNANYTAVSCGTGGNLRTNYEHSSFATGSVRLRAYDEAGSALADMESSTVGHGDQ